MDCRQTLFVGLVLTCLGAGCVGAGGRRGLVAQGQTAPPPTVVAQAPPGKKRSPLPSTCVACAISREREALKLEHDPSLQRELRDEARRAYQEALRLDPKHLPAHAGLGRLYTQMEDYDRAEETFRKAIEKLPKEPSLHFELGMLHCRRRNWQNAAQSFQAALEIDPENRHYRQTLGFMLARTGQIDQGLVQLTQAVGRSQAHYNVARMLLHLERPDEAKSHLEQALHANPNMQQAQHLLTQLTTVRDMPNLVSIDISFEPSLPVPPSLPAPPVPPVHE